MNTRYRFFLDRGGEINVSGRLEEYDSEYRVISKAGAVTVFPKDNVQYYSIPVI